MARKTKKQKQKEKEIIVTLLVVFGLALFIISVFKFGVVGLFLHNLIRFIFGELYGAIIVILIVLGCYYLLNKKLEWRVLVITICLIIAMLLITAVLNDQTLIGLELVKDFFAKTGQYFDETVTISCYGGVLGTLLYGLFSVLFAKEGTWIVISALFLTAIILAISIKVMKDKLHQLKDDSSDWLSKRKQEHQEKKIVRQQAKDCMLGSLDEKEETSVFLDVDDFNETENKEEIVSNKEIEPIKNEIEVSSLSSKIEMDEEIAAKDPIKLNQDKAINNKKPYRLPPFSLLKPIVATNSTIVNQKAAREKADKLIQILANFGIEAQLIATHIGPSVTKFEIKPDSNVKVNKINSIQDNIKMELAARDIRIEAPIPGKNAVGIEIPNVESTPVRMLELIRSIPNEYRYKKTLFILGKDLMGKAVFCELARMPHLLIAGATGSGKSVCMNTIITSFLMRTKPDEVKLLLIDPKKVEFTPYHNIPHLIGPVISDANEASNALKVVVKMMEDRYDIFSKEGVRNIESYNKKLKENHDKMMVKMPYIVIIIDELADLMAIAGKEVEISIQRITQLARAAGIHLIVATQRPSTDVITGIIKANIPSRIAFSVSSGIDSRTILDQVGAERLLGYGDMLYIPIGDPSATRLQGVYVTDEEVAKIAEFVSMQAIPMYDDAFIRLEGVENNEQTAITQASDDPLYQEIKKFVIHQQKASTSLLQRNFAIGYNRAARMIDVLEEKGIIGPAKGSKPRDVYMKKEEETND